jgi:hypothetical protein
VGASASSTLPAAPHHPWSDAWKLVLPKEHGSWSLAFEPIALGLLATPSRAGIPFAVAASAGFFLRRPLKVALGTQQVASRIPAWLAIGVLVWLGAMAMLATLRLAGTAPLWPLIPILCGGAIFLWFDTRNAGREGAAEIAGATAFGLLPAVFATLAGCTSPVALALAAVMLARAVPTVMLVRTRLRQAKGQVIATTPVWVLTTAATAWLIWLAVRSLVPWPSAFFAVLLLGRMGWYLHPRAPRLSARRIGIMELALGVASVLVTGLSWPRPA